MTKAAAADATAVTDEDRLRADFYVLLSLLLTKAPDQAMLDQIAALDGDKSELGQGIALLAHLAASFTPDDAAREYNALFIGLGRGELLPYASYYLTGFLNEKPLALLRDHMAKLGLERDPQVKEPEDHIAALCEMMAGLITGDLGVSLDVADQHAFFNTHLATWAGHFFTDLEGAKGAKLYAPVGTIGRLFIEIEIEAFRLDG
ncbi:molecular chaperone [Actibacterium sp. 188UL27-1]|uniref:TorD/DmsD family molecular chaperone n=1 Tax=Actibacterium sp. 188UL27-1 TaxID=2786961 RepID=UPI00195AE1E3|nr:molecular chaperone TorD family protein [Actibacterium sp. 188UL27-1]MBM7066964.1 molecular chaperone TorD family protein [Actibacterium sp. 188UL27-1]